MEPDQQSTSVEEIEQAFQGLNIRSRDAVAVLADASRWNLHTREELANAHILRILVDIVDCSVNDAIDTAELALRCIGNACIDNNTASQHVASLGFAWAKQCLPHDTAVFDQQLAMLTAKVLYNICSDFDPAQRQCFEEHVHWQLIPLCVADAVVRSNDKPLYIELLFWICSHVQPDQDHHRLPADTLATLLTIPTRFQSLLEPEDLATLIETCLVFLREPKAKHDIVGRKLVGQILDMVRVNEDLLAGLPEDHEDRRLLPPLTTALTWILSDVAASAEFASVYGLDDEWIQGVVIPTVRAVDAYGNCAMSVRLVDACCQILGNLLWSSEDADDSCPRIDHFQALAPPLLLLIDDKNDAELLHSAAALLVQLVRHFPSVRETVGTDARTKPAIEALCANALPQLKQDGIALLKALGRNSPTNQERFADLATDVLQSNSRSEKTLVEVKEN